MAEVDYLAHQFIAVLDCKVFQKLLNCFIKLLREHGELDADQTDVVPHFLNHLGGVHHVLFPKFIGVVSNFKLLIKLQNVNIGLD